MSVAPEASRNDCQTNLAEEHRVVMNGSYRVGDFKGISRCLIMAATVCRAMIRFLPLKTIKVNIGSNRTNLLKL